MAVQRALAELDFAPGELSDDQYEVTIVIPPEEGFMGVGAVDAVVEVALMGEDFDFYGPSNDTQPAELLLDRYDDGYDEDEDDEEPVVRADQPVYVTSELAWKLAEGDWCWLRLTSLTAELSQALVEQILPNLLPLAKIGQVELEVQPWQPGLTNNPWSAADSYTSLVRRAALATETRLEMEFSSITSFKKKLRNNHFEVDLPLPLPEMVFGNYLAHWSAFSSEQLPLESAHTEAAGLAACVSAVVLTVKTSAFSARAGAACQGASRAKTRRKVKNI